LKFLVDECTGSYVSKKLQEMNFDCLSVIECMRGAEDEDIIKRAVAEGRVIITNDKGFARIAEFYELEGIILLRLRDESAQNKVKITTAVIASYLQKIQGNLLVVSEKKIRVRPLKKNEVAKTVALIMHANLRAGTLNSI
jgi:predicted nuclease of predicted toxin-antitoxin system